MNPTATSLAELNRCAPGSLADNLRQNATGLAFGDLLNTLIARHNQGATASVAATGTVTIAGTVHTGDVVTITVDAVPAADAVAVAYTLVAGDSTATIAAASIGAALNANAAFAAEFAATNAAGLITITPKLKGAGGNTITLAAAVSGVSATTTATASGATLTGGSGANDIAAIV